MAGAIQKATQAQNTPAVGGREQTLALIKQMEPAIKRALPSVMTPERFTRIAASALSTTPKLAECHPMTFIGAMMTAAQLGLEPNTPLGQAYLIPFWNGKAKRTECQFQLGYKGMIDLAFRSGQISSIQAHVVYENDTFEYPGIIPNVYERRMVMRHCRRCPDCGAFLDPCEACDCWKVRRMYGKYSDRIPR